MKTKRNTGCIKEKFPEEAQPTSGNGFIQWVKWIRLPQQILSKRQALSLGVMPLCYDKLPWKCEGDNWHDPGLDSIFYSRKEKSIRNDK